METIKKRKQMAFDVSPEVHQLIKILAAKKNISMTLWVCRAIQKQINIEKGE